MSEQAAEKTVWACHRSFDFADGSRVTMLLRVFDEKTEAEGWMKRVQEEMGAQVKVMQLGVPHQDPQGQVTIRPVMPAGKFIGSLGISGIGHAIASHKISRDGQILVPKNGIILAH